jgi:hypothetical protein
MCGLFAAPQFSRGFFVRRPVPRRRSIRIGYADGANQLKPG